MHNSSHSIPERGPMPWSRNTHRAHRRGKDDNHEGDKKRPGDVFHRLGTCVIEFQGHSGHKRSPALTRLQDSSAMLRMMESNSSLARFSL